MPDKPRPWYLIDNAAEIDSPALVIYAERVRQNIALAIEMTGDVSRLRPHVKTHKTPAVTELMLQAGITKFKCATIAEAEMLAMCKAPDVLLAYQPTGPKINRMLSLIQQFQSTRFSCLVDSLDAAKAISDEAFSQKAIVEVFIDVNVGMNRTGVLPQNAVELFTACQELPGIRIGGIHGYDGHMNDTDLVLRRRNADEAFKSLQCLQDGLFAAGLRKLTIVVGGSPTFPFHAERSGVECSPGTFVYWDKSYSNLFPDMGFLPAALVLTRVVSVLNESTFCLDLGHKSIAAENPLSRRVHFMGTEGLKVVAQSEEHLVIETPAASHYSIGDLLYSMPYHVCPTCALYETAFVVEGDRVKEIWRMIARDRKISL